MRISQITEVKVINNTEEPLSDNDTVRVYHGTSAVDFVIVALTKGLTGGTRANRKYSYEFNNNPKGLFVTPDLNIAKEFGGYVIEFHTKVRDLEAPVWPGGAFTAQGGLSGVFDSDDDREAERIKQRMKWSDSEYDYIAQSSRPELAALLLMGGESQALFTGDLNSNSIRAVWASPDPSRIGQTYKRMSTKQFMQLANAGEVPTRFGTPTGLARDSDVARDSRKKLVTPRDQVTGDDVIDGLSKKYKMDREGVIEILKDHPEEIRKYVWSDRQYNQVWNDIRNMR